MSIYQNYRTYIYLISILFAFGCKNENKQHADQNTNNEHTEITSEVLPTDCDQLVEFIKRRGNISQYLSDADMNSTALNKASLYEYDGMYYVVIRFQDGNHDYIYCDIDLSYWNRFADNDEDSYGRGYQKWIRPYTSCNCGR